MFFCCFTVLNCKFCDVGFLSCCICFVDVFMILLCSFALLPFFDFEHKTLCFFALLPMRFCVIAAIHIKNLAIYVAISRSNACVLPFIVL